MGQLQSTDIGIVADRVKFPEELVRLLDDQATKSRNFSLQKLPTYSKERLNSAIMEFMKEHLDQAELLPLIVLLIVSLVGMRFTESWLAFGDYSYKPSLEVGNMYIGVTYFLLLVTFSVLMTAVFAFYSFSYRKIASTAHTKLIEKLFAIRTKELKKTYFLQTFLMFQSEQKLIDTKIQKFLFEGLSQTLNLITLVLSLNILSSGFLIIYSFIYLVLVYYFLSKTIQLAEPLSQNCNTQKNILDNLTLRIYSLCHYYKCLSMQKAVQSEYFHACNNFASSNYYIFVTVFSWLDTKFSWAIAISVTVVLSTSFLMNSYVTNFLLGGRWSIFLAILWITRLLESTGSLMKTYLEVRVMITSIGRVQCYIKEENAEYTDGMEYTDMEVNKRRQVESDSPYAF